MLKQKLLLSDMQLLNCQIHSEQNIEKSRINNYSEKKLDLIFENESELDPYTAFTIDKIYPAELNIYKRNVIKMSGPKRVDLNTVIEMALVHLNKNFTNNNNKLNQSHFSNGFYRQTSYNGFEYELYFKRKDFSCCFSIKLNRPLARLSVTQSSRKISKQIINFILPLTSDSKNMNAFRLFISSFETVAIDQDKYVTLTIVFGFDLVSNKRAHNEMNTFLSEFRERTRFENVKLIYVEMKDQQSFSRAKLLQIGSDSVDLKNESLLFFCDVDVLFNKNFLDMCRYNAARNERVFFPILYSFYNPSIVKNLANTSESNIYSNEDEDVEAARVSLIINKETGFWRDTGFGMVCLYKEDFKKIGGFDEYTKQNYWGGEDLHLYRKFLKTKLSTFRAISPGLFHLYHAKVCNKNKMNDLQFKNCLMSKVLNEASQKHFGFAYFNITGL